MRLRLALALVLLAGCGQAVAEGPTPAFSLLAVGDIGKPPEALSLLDPERAVAAAMAREDARSAIDALVLLGDNFYPEGLRRDEVKERLRENLVGPFCRFIELTRRGAGSLRDACPEAAAVHPVPLFAVLGNHDYGEPESPDLQRLLVPEYVASWHMPGGPVEVRELRGGVSLILLDSNRLERGDGERDAARSIAASRGPWRVVAAHHPMARVSRRQDPRFGPRLRGLLQQAGVAIHVYVSGHEHNLQAFVGVPGAALQLVAGSGSDIRALREAEPGRRFAAASLGFVRLDVRRGDDPRLVATLLTVPRPPLPALGHPAARFSVTPDGRVAEVAIGSEGS